MRLVLSVALFVISTTFFARLSAQAPASVEFDVVSIKRVDAILQTGGMSTLPDGTLMMRNQPIGTLVNTAWPVELPLRDIVGMPAWLMRERYDITVKPPAGMTPEQRRNAMPLMWRAMFADRLKLAAHFEQREKDAYTLVLARSDGRLGPQLTPSTLDCTPRPNATPLATPQTVAPLQERQNRCGMALSSTQMVSGSVTLDQIARSLGNVAGGETENRTGLTGSYAVTLNFSVQPGAGVDDAPSIFTAVQEQLGLKLLHEKKVMAVLVIDHIERPSEN